MTAEPARTRSRAGALAIAVCAPLAALAIEFWNLEVSNEGRRYHVAAQGTLEAPAASVLYAVTDFDHLDRLSETILESEYLGPEEGGGHRVRTLIEFCVAFFCEEAEQIQIVTFPRPDQVVSRVIPELSDIPQLDQQWYVVAHEGGSQLTYVMTVYSEDFIPPLIGPLLVRRALHRLTTDTAGNIERIAREHAGLDDPAGG